MEFSRVEASLPSLPVELLYAIHIIACNPSFPVSSKHLYLTFHNAPSSMKARYLLHLANEYTALELLTTHLTKILTYPICTQRVLQRYMSLLEPYYLADILMLSEQPTILPGIQVVFTLPKRLFRDLPTVGKTVDQTTDFVKYLCSIPPVYRLLPRQFSSERREIEPIFPSPNMDSHSGYPLIRAVQVKCMPLILLLLSDGASPRKRGFLAILLAIRHHDLALTQLLVEEASAAPTSVMLNEAVKVQASDIVEWLVKEKGCVPDMRTLRLMG